MGYAPYEEPKWLDPEVTQRQADGLWLVWVWLPMPAIPLGMMPDGGWMRHDCLAVVHTKQWQIARVFGTKGQANKFAKRWIERRKKA